MVLDMAYHLHNQGYNVQVDMFQRHFMGMDKMAWLDDKVENVSNIQLCSFVIVKDFDSMISQFSDYIASWQTYAWADKHVQ